MTIGLVWRNQSVTSPRTREENSFEADTPKEAIAALRAQPEVLSSTNLVRNRQLKLRK